MPVPANVIRANIRATVGANEEIVHTLHYERVNTTLATEPSLQAIAEEIVARWTNMLTTGYAGQAALQNSLRTDLVYRTVDTYSLGTDGKATGQGQASFGTNAKGIGTATPLPPEVALVASLRTGLPGRSKRGRLYMGGFTTSALAAGGVAATHVPIQVAASLAEFGQQMQMDPQGGADRLNWVVLSKTTSSVARITQVKVGNVFDVQRRRQNGMTEAFDSASITY